MKEELQDRYTDEEMLNMRVVTWLYRAVKSMRKREAEKINASGVTFAQFEVLVIVQHFGPMSVGDIINRTLSSIGNISLVINNLVKDGYLLSCQSETDKRAKQISLTEKGVEYMDGFFPDHLANLKEILSVFTEEEKQQLISLVKKI